MTVSTDFSGRIRTTFLELNRVLEQGCELFPLLFELYVSKMPEIWKNLKP
jgi:hypothetical protein